MKPATDKISVNTSNPFMWSVHNGEGKQPGNDGDLPGGEEVNSKGNNIWDAWDDEE